MSASQEKILEKATEEWLKRITNPKTRAHNEQVLAEFVAFIRESRIPWEQRFTIETLKDFQRASKCKKAAGAIRALSFFLYDQQKIPEPILNLPWGSQFVIRVINKRSNNVMARTLFLTLGAARENAPGSVSKARKAVGDWLNESGLAFPELVLDNGSGLSRETRISAESMGRLLGYAYASPNMPEFISSLSIAGVDGSLERRLMEEPYRYRVRGKTGWIREVSALSGYAQSLSGDVFAFSILFNNYRGMNVEMKAVQDSICRAVVDG